jgi:hypothetical protein
MYVRTFDEIHSGAFPLVPSRWCLPAGAFPGTHRKDSNGDWLRCCQARRVVRSRRIAGGQRRRRPCPGWKHYQIQIVPADLNTQQMLFSDLFGMTRNLPVKPLTLVDDSA